MSLADKLVLFGRPRLPIILQSEAAECGLACLAMVATFHGHEIDLVSIRRRFAVSSKGMSLQGILAMAGRIGLLGRGLRLEIEQLKKLKTPAILHWDMKHFVVLKEVKGRRIIIHDPTAGIRAYTLEEAGRHFTGIALELTPAANFEKKKEIAKLPLSRLWGHLSGIGRALTQALVLSIVLQIIVLASPFYMQLVVDDAIMKEDSNLLVALALGFGLLVLINTCASWLRSHVLLFLGNALGFQMGANLFAHLVRLPLDWFEKRHVGDIVSRFRSTGPVQDLIAKGLIAAVVDGIMALLTLVMILVYSPLLSIVVLVALGVNALTRFLSYRLSRRIEEEFIDAEAKESSNFIETARAIQSIKIFCNEADRETLWQDRHADKIGRTIKKERVSIHISEINQLVSGLQNILVIYIGARAVISGEMTVGMLYAFMAYKEQFFTKATALIDMVIQYRMLDLHMLRISDIALSSKEEYYGQDGSVPHVVRGAIELKNVSYSYAETDPDVLSQVSLSISPGEFVAITGPSGGGKTTLLKVMLGLFKPQSGIVLIDSTPLEKIGAQTFRSQIGVVMQDDQLLSGTISDNICFFEQNFDMEWMHECAVMAGIADEILAMPMNYNTLIGDMGTNLSGGQRQRILLARALYRKPRILFIDEGTSSLDLMKEREVNESLAKLNITRVIIAHRPETIKAADRIILLNNGQVASMAA